ncbi:unnamed protein product [Symbiodinium sp. KB8]|nr:unnamed protein product [Symbiodinium sp. KB8]
MAEIRQQALMGAGKRSSMFFGIGTNKTSGDPNKKGKATTGKLSINLCTLTSSIFCGKCLILAVRVFPCLL